MNRGGAESLLRLGAPAVLDQQVALAPESLAALESWQARPGMALTVIDPDGCYFRARLLETGPEGPLLLPFERLPQAMESPLQLELYQALPQKERFELVLEKATELGVSRIVPYESEHSISLAERDARQKKSHRWPDLVVRAARQCRRASLPQLYPALSWDQALWLSREADLKLFLYEGETDWLLREGLESAGARRVALLVGPEGGFSAEEARAAQNLGFLAVGLGPRILRTETAALAALSIAQHLLGDLG